MHAPRFARRALIVLLIGSAVARMHAQDGGGASRGDGATFVARFRSALAARDRQQLAGLFRYPLRVGVPTLPRPVFVKDAASLVRMYDLLFTPTLRCAVEQSRVPAPGSPRPPHALLIADGAVSLADGHVVAERTPEGFRVTRLSTLGEEARRARKPRRVAFDEPGGADAKFTGRLAHDDTDVYWLTARKGQRLVAGIERFPGRSLLLKVTELGSGRVLNSEAQFARTWTSPALEAAEYQIAVVRNAAYCDPDLTYLLTVSLR